MCAAGTNCVSSVRLRAILINSLKSLAGRTTIGNRSDIGEFSEADYSIGRTGLRYHRARARILLRPYEKRISST